MLIWQGRSRYGGAAATRNRTIKAILTGYDPVKGYSRNIKTGPMVQLHILVAGQTPYQAQQTGSDVLVCGTCSRRPSAAGRDGLARCYVRTEQGPTATHKAHQGERVAPRSAWPDRMIAALGLRVGSYGDPAMLPPWLVQELVRVAGGRHTAYTHEWNRKRAEWLRPLAMASVDSVAELQQATAAGWRAFWAQDAPSDAAGLVHCPASIEMGHRTTCQHCTLCQGTSSKPSVYTYAHGYGRNRTTSNNK